MQVNASMQTYIVNLVTLLLAFWWDFWHLLHCIWHTVYIQLVLSGNFGCLLCLVTPLTDYYIVAGVVYQAPDLSSVINSRLVRHFIYH